MTLSPQARNEVQWWVTHIYPSQKFLHAPPITTIIYSDASLEGWGATDSISTIGALWRDTDELMHINVLELTAARLALTTLAEATRGTDIQLKMDNLTDVVAYLTSMYDRSLQYTTIASAKSVLSGMLHIPGVISISSHPLIIRLLKGIFHVRPPKPCYEFIWDTELVLTFLKNLHLSAVTLKLLTLKTVTLLTLLSG